MYSVFEKILAKCDLYLKTQIFFPAADNREDYDDKCVYIYCICRPLN